MGFIKLSDEEKNAAPDPEALKKYRQHIEEKEEEFRKIEERDSVESLKILQAGVKVVRPKDEELDDYSEEQEESSSRFSEPPPSPEERHPALRNPVGRPAGIKGLGALTNLLNYVASTVDTIAQKLLNVETSMPRTKSIVEKLSEYTHQEHENMMRRIRESIPKYEPVDLSTIESALTELLENQNRLTGTVTQLTAVINAQNLEIAKLREKAETPIARAPETERPKAGQPNLRDVLAQAFKQAIDPIEPFDNDDLVRIERIYDLALEKENTNTQKATERFVTWLQEFRQALADNPKMEPTVFQFFGFVKQLP